MKVKYTKKFEVSENRRFVIHDFSNAEVGEAEEIQPEYSDRESARIRTLQYAGMSVLNLLKRPYYIINGEIYSALEVQKLK